MKGQQSKNISNSETIILHLQNNKTCFPPFKVNNNHLMKIWSVWHSFLFFLLCSMFSGQFGSQRLAGDLGVCGRPGCDEGSGHQRRPGDTGARGQSLPKTGEGEPDGRVEVLHLLWVSGVPLVGSAEAGLRDVHMNHGIHIRGSMWIRWVSDFTFHQTVLNVISINISPLWFVIC